MPIELKVPPVGESIAEVRIEKWLKGEGATVARDEPVCVLESDKATIELPSPVAGRILKILKPAGSSAPIEAVLAHLEETPQAAGANTAKAETAAPPPPAPATPLVVPPPETPEAGRMPAAPEGPVVPEEVRYPCEERQEEKVPMTPIRLRIAERLVQAHQTMALVSTFSEIDMSETLRLREKHQGSFQEKYKAKLGLMPFFIKAAIAALKQFPQLNAKIQDSQIVYHKYFDIAVAVSGGKGLVTPVLRNAEKLSFSALELAIRDFGARAQANKLALEELRGGTFTITNGGVFGSLLSTPIINPPQSGILGMHAIQERPVAIAGQVVIRPMMYVALTYDHRLVDGREAVLFLKSIKQYIEEPASLLLEI